MRIPLRFAVLLTTALALVMAAPASAAKVPRSFFGVQAWGIPTEREAQMLGSTRSGTFRATLLWSVVEPTRGVRRWGDFDLTVARAARANATVLPVLLSSPQFVAARFQYPPSSPDGKAAFSTFVREAVARYGRNGTFWRANPGLPYRPVNAWQVWNEPNFPAYWNRRPNARQYVALLRSARSAIKGADRRAKVVIAGIPETKFPGSITMSRYLKQVYRVRGARKLFDAVAIHPYASNLRGLERSIKRARAVMKKGRDARKSLWITELGWATGGTGKKVYRTSRRGQAKLLKSTLTKLVKLRRKQRIGMAVWFALRDKAPDPGEPNWWALHTGLLDLAGNPKPAWGTFQSLTRRLAR